MNTTGRKNRTYGPRGAMSDRVYRALHAAQARGDHVCLVEYRDAYRPLAHMLGADGLVRDGLGRQYGALLRAAKSEIDSKRADSGSVETMLIKRLMTHLHKSRARGAVIYRQTRSAEEGHAIFAKRFGYSVESLRAHIESLFTPAMTWPLVERSDVHISLKYPARMFNLSTPDGIRRAYALDNLLPMWRRDDIVKARTTDVELLALFGEGLC